MNRLRNVNIICFRDSHFNWFAFDILVQAKSVDCSEWATGACRLILIHFQVCFEGLLASNERLDLDASEKEGVIPVVDGHERRIFDSQNVCLVWLFVGLWYDLNTTLCLPGDFVLDVIYLYSDLIAFDFVVRL